MKTLKLLLLIIFPALLHAQVTNVVKTVLNKETGLFSIQYDLNKQDIYNYYTIELKATLDGKPLKVEAVSGDVGLIEVGKNKQIIWNAYVDHKDGWTGSKLDFDVIGTPDPKDADPDPLIEPDTVIQAKPEIQIEEPTKSIEKSKKGKTGLWIGLGGSIVAGGALIYFGSDKVSEANDLYDIYKNYKNESDPVYNDKSREEYYDEANSNLTTGRVLQITGAAIIVGGGFFFINKLLKAKTNDKVVINVSPVLDTRSPGHRSGVVFSMNIRF